VIDKAAPNADCCLWNVPTKMGKAAVAKFFITNSGNTSTERLQVLIGCYQNGPGPRPPEPFSLFKWDDQRAVSYVIGPKQTIEVMACEFMQGELFNAQMGIIRHYLIGEVDYHDMVEPSRLRITRFVHQLIVLNPGTDNLDGVSLVTVAQGKNNCTDEDCK
jgi:hypothetical protein